MYTIKSPRTLSKNEKLKDLNQQTGSINRNVNIETGLEYIYLLLPMNKGAAELSNKFD